MLDFGESVVGRRLTSTAYHERVAAVALVAAPSGLQFVQRSGDLLQSSLEPRRLSAKAEPEVRGRLEEANRGRGRFFARASGGRRTPSRRPMPRMRGNTTVPADSTHSSSGRDARNAVTIAAFRARSPARARPDRRDARRRACPAARRRSSRCRRRCRARGARDRSTSSEAMTQPQRRLDRPYDFVRLLVVMNTSSAFGCRLTVRRPSDVAVDLVDEDVRAHACARCGRSRRARCDRRRRRSDCAGA